MNASFLQPRALLLPLPPLVLGAAAVLQFQIALNHDVAWFILAAQRMVHGGSYLTDFFEVNMPLGIAAYIPVDWLSALAGISAAAATRCWVLLLAIQSVALCVVLLRPGQGSLLAGWLFAGLVALPAYEFAQKEHLTAVLSLPFMCLLTGERGASVPLRVYVTLLAALGAYMKPHYAALPFLVLTLCNWRGGLRASLQSLEFGVLLGSGLFYGAMVLLLYPGWFEVAAWARDLYGSYRAAGWFQVVTAEIAIGGALLAFLAVLAVRDRSAARTLAPFLVAAAYGLLAYLLQFKGWRYQALPFGIFTFVALGVALRSLAGAPAGPGFPRRQARIAILGMLVIAGAHAVTAALSAPRTTMLMKSSFAQALSGLPRGTPVAALSTATVPFFPTIALFELKWSLRYSSLWPLAGLASAQGESSAAADLMDRYRGPFVTGLVDDLARYRPVAVIVDERPGQFGLPEGFRILDFLLADPRFAAVWSGYVAGMKGEGFVVYFAR